MSKAQNTYLTKLKSNLPWLARYPFARAKSVLSQNLFEKKHVIFVVANHFEPSWKKNGFHDWDAQLRRLDEYHKMARATGEAVRDADGTKFRHTNFYPAEQYEPRLLEKMAEMQAEGLGDVEIHLHHGIEKPDTPENLRKSLVEFRDVLAERHKCLSRLDGAGEPMYAFVHGNLALANSCGGKFCGVDEEMQILQETGCYVDMTLPSAPDETQVPIINQIYECGLPLNEKMPHRKSSRVGVYGNQPRLPLIFQGPLIFNWKRRIKGLPVPRLDDGALTANQPLDLARLNRWLSANVTVEGKSDWVFVKLYCHGFFDYDQSACIGEDARRFFGEVIENGERTGKYKVHFATAREAFNMVAAAIDGKKGTPNDFRNYRLQAIMDEKENFTAETPRRRERNGENEKVVLEFANK
ncbi:MAG: hypothetical protein M3384_09305 [Acidobacteriota bacterium]|nr:hypothetical protein [Acidobacteriota bacterium]